ncbi:hypothetical protein B0H16DRAFT_1460915 [Mycena metata]|uniref:Uncharacterized protein n=1 Tax=Mycena metata TaxID=1033252 RepID=A0AAD7IT31_9AGAR|nr:hypothetical protein B0H16DRAFT_1460915 [Mycena metata]
MLKVNLSDSTEAIAPNHSRGIYTLWWREWAARGGGGAGDSLGDPTRRLGDILTLELCSGGGVKLLIVPEPRWRHQNSLPSTPAEQARAELRLSQTPSSPDLCLLSPARIAPPQLVFTGASVYLSPQSSPFTELLSSPVCWSPLPHPPTPGRIPKPESSAKPSAPTLQKRKLGDIMSVTIPDFSGDRLDTEKKITTVGFMRKCGLYFRHHEIGDMECMLLDVQGHLDPDSPEDQWFKNIASTDPRKANWIAFITAFEARFQIAAPPPKPAAQLQAALSGMQIGVEELAKGTILVNGARVAVMRDFAAHVNNLVTDANAGAEQGAALWLFYDVLEPWLRVAVGAIPANWDSMVTALIDVQIDAMCIVPATYQAQAPGTGLGEQWVWQWGVGVREVERWAAERRRAEVQRVEVREEEAGDFVLAGTIARRATDQAQYTQQRAEWETRNGNVPTATLDIALMGHPLTPGTENLATGECWDCGYRESPIHRGDCRGRTRVPTLEHRFRAVCGGWLLPSRNNAGVNVVEEEEEQQGVPWYEAGDANANTQQSF